MKKITSALALLVLLLTACGSFDLSADVSPPATAVDGSPESRPTHTDEGLQEVDKEDPTPNSASQEPLPAPLVVLIPEDSNDPLSKNQLWRVERDGSTTVQITDETIGVDSFGVSPVDGSIAYVSGNDLYRIDSEGNARTMLVDGPAPETIPQDRPALFSIRAPRWSADGQQIAYGLGALMITPAEGGQSRTLLDPVAEPSGQVRGTRFYQPLSWSPRGDQILALERLIPEGGSYVLVDVASGEMTPILDQDGSASCCNPSWTPDGDAIYYSSASYGLFLPGLWRAEAQTGQAQTLIAGYEGDLAGLPEETNPQTYLLMGARLFEDGDLYAFSASGAFKDLFGDDSGGQLVIDFHLTRYTSNGGSPELVRPDAFHPIELLWAEDGSGALIITQDLLVAPYPLGLTWVPMDGTAPLDLPLAALFPQWGR